MTSDQRNHGVLGVGRRWNRKLGRDWKVIWFSRVGFDRALWSLLYGLNSTGHTAKCSESVELRWVAGCDHSARSDSTQPLLSRVRSGAVIRALESRGNYDSVTLNNMKLVHWPLMGGLLHLLQRGGDWVGPKPAQAPPCCTKCNSPPINGQYTNHRIAV